MPNTSNLSLPYPAGSDAPNGPAAIAALANAVDGWLINLPTWKPYTCTWTAATTNPVLGNGTIAARYMELGATVFCAGVLLAGSTTTFGAGTWQFSLPVTAKFASPPLLMPGSSYLFDNSTPANRQGATTVLFDADTFYVQTVAAGSVGAVAPFTWVNGDRLQWSFVYEA